MFTVRQMRYFEALVTTQHFGMAAEMAGISQPALSVQIAEMEKMVGAPLFERMSKKVILTDIGRRFLPVIHDVLNRMGEFEKISSTSRGPYHSAWRIGIISTVAPYLLAPLLPAIEKHNPELKLEILEARTETLHQKISAGSLDLVIAADSFPDERLTRHLLFADKFYLASSSEDKDCAGGLPSPEAIKPERLLLLEDGHCLRDQMLDLCKTGNFRKEFSATELTTILQLVSYNFGVTLIPQLACMAEHKNRHLRISAFTRDKPQRKIFLFWRNRTPHQADYENFAGLIRQAVTPLLAEAEKLVNAHKPAA
ncbi:MAG: hydrogen peroxide-inducible genes activator [Candidatus Tokpelaia sp.]|uniref:hydrogen peroxide-inducible genes activator n=1 Tax=Candidatus Tokpelaia sp. TaxID=2233777 RepID=UPI00123BAF78|nr:hydrogen peroxide-inducible genes activator [Candidatus Tokpelaia sp.]KAA6204690.1 MAG: hydrogen peroxide-inducible genes activator [Candidatus Tokpelaia sp.]KAA6206138.1 MAG: hydrogen peroxide-inducible genes activator [Candidatus Tokpelaia sp.]KAA6405746.1 hydrogen peroxide-inducible genes activator [Candidatus Tokpelaia sp.]